MQLHQLPTELLVAVLREVVQGIGLRKSVQLRLTSKRFDPLTLDAIYSLPTFEEVEDDGPKDLRRDPAMSKRMLAGLILYKLKHGDSAKRALCVAIQQASTYISNQLALEDEANISSDYATALATAAAHSMYFEDVIFQLSLSSTPNEAVRQVASAALIAATLTNQITIIDRLIAEGVDVVERTRYFGDALSAAARFGSESTFELLFKQAHTSKLGVKTSRRLDLLEVAAIAGREEIIRQFLVPKGSTLEADRRCDRMILSVARADQEKVVSFLLQHRVPIPDQGDDDVFWFSLACISCQKGYESILGKILKADVMPRGERYMEKCMEEACRCGQTRIVHLLLPYCHKWMVRVDPEPLYWAARGGNTDILNLLLDKLEKANVTTITRALAGAVHSQRRDVVFQLIDKARTRPLRETPWDILDGRALDLFREAVELMLE